MLVRSKQRNGYGALLEPRGTWLTGGHLREADHGHRREIEVSSCKRFQREYISIRELGDLLGWSHRRMAYALEALLRPPQLLRLKQRAGWFVRRSGLPAMGC